MIKYPILPVCNHIILLLIADTGRMALTEALRAIMLGIQMYAEKKLHIADFPPFNLKKHRILLVRTRLYLL